MKNSNSKVSYLPTIFSHRDEFITPFDKMFDELVNSSFPEFGKNFGVDFFGRGSYPKCDIVDLPDKLEIEMEIPGVDKQDISIEIKPTGNTKELVIKGKKLNEEKEEKRNYIMKELKRSAFMRSFTLYDGLESDNINAEFKNGILKIDIPKKEPQKIVEAVTKVEIK